MKPWKQSCVHKHSVATQCNIIYNLGIRVATFLKLLIEYSYNKCWQNNAASNILFISAPLQLTCCACFCIGGYGKTQEVRCKGAKFTLLGNVQKSTRHSMKVQPHQITALYIVYEKHLSMWS